MRILMIADIRTSWVPNFARFFAGRGDDVLVVSFSPGEIEGIKTEYIGASNYDYTRNKHLFITRIPRLRKIIRRFKPDLLFAIYLASNGLASALAWSGPLVVSAIGSDVLDRNKRTGFRKFFRESIIKYVAKRADVLNTVSQEIDEELIRLSATKSKLLQIPFGVNMDMFNPAENMPRSEVTQFICIRGHKTIYDIPTVIESLVLLNNRGRKFHCTLTGGGPLIEENRRLVQAAGLNHCITFTGYLDFTKLPELLRQADVYISASLGDGTSVSLLEGMASGLFPVVSRIKANTPWIDHGQTGLLFDVGQPGMLAKQLEQAMDDTDLRKKAFKKNIQLIDKKCNMARNMQRLASVFEQLVEGKKLDFTQ